jgi:hypothetical protein
LSKTHPSQILHAAENRINTKEMRIFCAYLLKSDDFSSGIIYFSDESDYKA